LNHVVLYESFVQLRQRSCKLVQTSFGLFLRVVYLNHIRTDLGHLVFEVLAHACDFSVQDLRRILKLNAPLQIFALRGFLFGHLLFHLLADRVDVNTVLLEVAVLYLLNFAFQVSVLVLNAPDTRCHLLFHSF
jgi:hypothetical protein